MTKRPKSPAPVVAATKEPVFTPGSPLSPEVDFTARARAWDDAKSELTLVGTAVADAQAALNAATTDAERQSAEQLVAAAQDRTEAAQALIEALTNPPASRAEAIAAVDTLGMQAAAIEDTIPTLSSEDEKAEALKNQNALIRAQNIAKIVLATFTVDLPEPISTDTTPSEGSPEPDQGGASNSAGSAEEESNTFLEEISSSLVDHAASSVFDDIFHRLAQISNGQSGHTFSSIPRQVLVVTARQDSRWRAGRNFGRADSVLELEGDSALTKAEFDAIRADPVLVSQVVDRT